MKDLIFDIKSEMNAVMNFWLNMMDRKNGGFYCSVDYNLHVDKLADKSGVAIARNLWTFSKAYAIDKKQEYLYGASHAYDFLINNLIDIEHKGAYWILDNKGNVKDKRKHIYLQAFCIYALSEYYAITSDKTAIDTAMELYHLIETTGYDKLSNSYKEEFTEDWQEKDNDLLSENGVIASITTNTHLHILEAYTNLYRVNQTKEIRNSLVNIIDIFYKRIFSKETSHLKVFFDDEWNEVIDLKSFGHDIEASWLIDDALKLLDDYDSKYDDMVIKIAQQILNTAIETDGSVINESEDGVLDKTRIWWVQAEAAVGFYNAYEKTDDEKYLDAFNNVWKYIKDFVIDKRDSGEWLYSLDKDNEPIIRDVVELWKAPYHNGRCCFELYERIVR